jgi:DNA-directed RNA polymerase subunit RPC12/RpoP
MRVEARSVIQAEAVLRRRGYEVAVQTAVRCVEPGQVIPPTELRPLACASCGDQLSGLTIEKASVRCPECSFQQPLVVRDPEMLMGERPMHPAVLLLAGIGLLSVGLLALVIHGVILSL